MKRLFQTFIGFTTLFVAVGCDNEPQQPLIEGNRDSAYVFTDCKNLHIEYIDNIVWQASGDKKIHVSCIFSDEESRCLDIEQQILADLRKMTETQFIVTINDAIVEAKITANKELFGIPAGGILNDYFLVKGPTFSHYYVTYPDYKLETDIGREELIPVSSIINADHTTALQVQYWLPNPPPESPDEVNFTFTYTFLSGTTHSATCTMRFEY